MHRPIPAKSKDLEQTSTIVIALQAIHNRLKVKVGLIVGVIEQLTNDGITELELKNLRTKIQVSPSGGIECRFQLVQVDPEIHIHISILRTGR